MAKKKAQPKVEIKKELPPVVETPVEVKVEKRSEPVVQAEPSQPVSPELIKAMKKFDKEVKANDPDLIQKWMSYFPGAGINW